MNKELIIKCCHCKTSFEYKSSKYRPFCSERCQMIDLGKWTSESYAIASNAPLSEEDIEKVIKASNDE